MKIYTWLAGVAARIGLTGLAIAILIGLLAVQTVRLEGFKLWPFSIEGAKPRGDRLEGELQAIRNAQRDARGAQQAVNDAAEQIYTGIAERMDDDADKEKGRELDAVDRYIAANGVLCGAGGSAAGQAVAAAGDHGAGNGDARSEAAELHAADGAPGGALAGGGYVAVPANDLKICATNTLQAESARAWAIAIEAASRTAPAP